MNNEFDIQKINQALLRVCNSEAFKSSPRSVRLFKFLVGESIKGNFVKEQIIGLELFKRKYDPSKNDAKVRVYMFNLRKKLNEYYLGEGQFDDLRFEIKKGQYNLTFYKQTIAEQQSFFQKYKIAFIIAFGVISLNAGIWMFWNANKELSYCWDVFLSDPTETVCLISDHFMLSGKLVDGSTGIVRKPFINSESDLSGFLRSHKEYNYRKTDFSFMTKMAPMAIHDLTRWFISNDKDFSIRLESEFSYEDLRNTNLIFIGQWKTMSASKSIFLRNSNKFSIKSQKLVLTSNGDTTDYPNELFHKKRIDYAIVSFMPLDDEHEALFFASNNDIGVVATINNFTNRAWLKEFYTNIPPEIKYFNALFKVKGIGRTEMNCELEQIEFIK